MFHLQMFSARVPDGGWSPFRETPRLWQHVASSRQRRMLVGRYYSTGSQRVNTFWISEYRSYKITNIKGYLEYHYMLSFSFLWLQVSFQTLQSHTEGPRWLCHWCWKSCKCKSVISYSFTTFHKRNVKHVSITDLLSESWVLGKGEEV